MFRRVCRGRTTTTIRSRRCERDVKNSSWLGLTQRHKDYEVKMSCGLPVTHNLRTPSPYNSAPRYGDGPDSKQTATALQHGQASVGAPFNQLRGEHAPFRL